MTINDCFGAMPSPRSVATALGSVECIDRGQGPTLLAVHGAMGGYDRSWILARALATDFSAYRVIAVSRPGYLGTPLSLGEDPVQQADLMIALLEALGVTQAIVVAMSAGGPSALQLAARRPDLCRSLILVSAATGRLAISAGALERMRKMGAMAGNPGIVGLIRQKALSDPQTPMVGVTTDPTLRERTLYDPDGAALLSAFQASMVEGLTLRLPGSLNDVQRFVALDPLPFAEIIAPTLVIHANDDSVVPFTHAQAAAQGVRAAEMISIPNGGHMCLFTHLEEIRPTANRYLTI
jgi:pimeloyl-ACP methyl ester carboxylesterase